MKVLMMGVAPEERGGISTLARQIIDQAAIDESMDLRYLSTTSNGKAAEKVRLFLTALAAERKALSSGFDIVHLHMANNASFLRAGVFSRAAISRGSRVVLQIHCDLAKFYDAASGPARRSIDFALASASRIIVMGGYLDAFLESRGVARSRVSLLRNSVPVERRNPYNPKACKALFLGNVCPEKGVLDLLDAIVSLQYSLPDWFSLDICGRDLIGIESAIASRGLAGIVSYKGQVDVDSVFLDSYMINILPSHNEALPFALLEVSAHGIPSVVSDAGTMPEVVEDGRTGWVVSPGDVPALAKAIDGAIHDKERLQEMSSLIHQTVFDNFSFANYYQSLKRLYAEVAM